MVDIRQNNSAGLSLSTRRDRIIIHHATILALGEPEYIRFLINQRDRKVAVQCCEQIDRNHILVPEAESGKEYRFEISSTCLISVVYKICGWDQGKTYVVYGKAHPKHRLVEFDLDTAQIIAADQFEEPELLVTAEGCNGITEGSNDNGSWRI